MNNTWIWTTELVTEAISTLAKKFSYPNEHSDMWEGIEKEIKKFKASKEVKKDYEILECYTSDINLTHEYYPYNGINNSNCDTEKCKIKSVKRISDNEVFTVGDKISGLYGTVFNKIKSFEINKGNLEINLEGGSSILEIKYATKEVKKPILGITEDGVKKFDSEIVWSVREDFSLSRDVLYTYEESGSQFSAYRTWKFFHSEEKAKEYILMNKPCLSVQDMITHSGWYSGGGTLECRNFNVARLQKVVQKKIDGLQ